MTLPRRSVSFRVSGLSGEKVPSSCGPNMKVVAGEEA